MYKQKYLKYKNKYLSSKNKSNEKKLFAFVDDVSGYDTQIIIVKAKDIDDAYDELQKVPQKKVFSKKSEYAVTHDLNRSVNEMIKQKIIPIEVDTPFYFSLYNG
jgi:hypothetical protein